ncbi:MAG: mechanosensitive ion channel family protein [Hyphomicrobiales bacterium]
MPVPIATPPFRNPEAVAAFDLATLLVRLGLIVLGAIILLRISAILVGRLERAIRRAGGEEGASEKRARTLGAVLRGVARSAVVIVAILMGVRELGLDITPALAAAGGFGVAAGLGAQSLIRDWISGFFIIYDNQYVVGDVVRVQGVAGTVEALTLRHTELRDGDGAVHYLANGEIKLVTNLTKSWSAPVVRIPVNLTEDPARVTAILEGYLAEFAADPAMAPLLRDPPRLLGMEDVTVGQYTMMLQVRTLPEHRFTVSRALRMGIVTRLREAGVLLHSAAASDVPPPPSPAPTAGPAGTPAPRIGGTA